MARLNDEAQWIILLAFIISISIFFLALIVNEATLVGQTTAESVIDLPKSDVQDLRNQILSLVNVGIFTTDTETDINLTSLATKNALVRIVGAPNGTKPASGDTILIHFNNGVTIFDETYFY